MTGATVLFGRTCFGPHRDLFQRHYKSLRQQPALSFAEPGKERQDSVYNGLQHVRPEAELVAVHDSARPLIEATDAKACMEDALQVSCGGMCLDTVV